jgi:phosphoribosylformimino-5-aminoimidazole carboxamide ribotide isomerase
MIKMIIPVMDIKGNECVSGKSGNRESYDKLKSIYGDNPIEIASNLKKSGYSLLYIADLDRIENKGDNTELISRINEIIPVLLDNGISTLEDVKANENVSTYSIVATETMNDLNDIQRIIRNYPNDKLAISIDIKDNQLLIGNRSIGIEDIVELINASNIRYVILLNISHVGTKVSDRSDFEKYLRDNMRDVEFIMAGGITKEAIDEYQKENITNFLVGTMLHEGNL